VVQALASEDVQLLGQLEAGIVATDGAGIIVRWNANAERILGVPASNVLGRPWTDSLAIVRGENVDGKSVLRAALLAEGWLGALQVRVADERDLWIRARIQRTEITPGHEKAGVVAVFWADTTLSLAVDGDRRAGLPYRDLFRNSLDALMLLDIEGRVVEANGTAAAMHGLSTEEMIGRSFLGQLVDWTPADTEASHKELLASGSVVREVTLRRTDGECIRVEAVVSIVSPTGGCFVLARIRDLSRVHERENMLRDLGNLARLGDAPIDVEEITRRALGVVAGMWNAEASIAVLEDPRGFRIVAGPDTSETIRAAFSGLDPADSHLANRIRESDGPFEIDFQDDSPAADWAVRGRAVGLRVLRSTPLWFGDRRLGAILLLWTGQPTHPFDAERLDQMGRFAGLAIGNADLRGAMQRDAATRASLEGTARVGGVVLSQMAEAIVTADADRRITAVNPAAEKLYGFGSEAAVGRPIEEIVEQSAVDGTVLTKEWTDSISSPGFWHGRVIHTPLIGPAANKGIVVDLSVTQLHDERRRPAGMIILSREVTASSHLDSDAALLAALALATSRSRTRGEVANAVLERLCEATTADFGVIALWDGPGKQIIEASRGLSQELLQAIASQTIPEVGAALDMAGGILPVTSFAALQSGAEVTASLARDGVATGFVVDMRVRDDSIGFVGLGSRRAAWIRPRDEVVLQIASQVTSALENARLMERLELGLDQERNLTAQLETLMGLTLLPQAEVSEEAVAQVLLERIVKALGADSGCVVRENANRFHVVAQDKTPPAVVNAFESHPADEFAFWRSIQAAPEGGAFRVPLSGASVSDPDLDQFNRMVASMAVFPIQESDLCVGAFLCYFSNVDSVSQADERNIEAVGRIISIAYSNVRMSESLAEAAEHERRLTAELRALQELTLLGATTDDLTRLAQETIEEVVTATGASGGGYILIDPSVSRVEPVVWVGQPSQRWVFEGETPLAPRDWPSITQLQADRSVWLPDLRLDSEEGAPTSAQAVLPLRVDDRLAGALHLEWAERPPLEQYDVHFLEPIARISSISLANFRLRAELVHRAAAQRALGHRIDTLDELTRIGEEASSFDELAHRTVNLVREALGAGGVCYLLIEPGHHFETHAVAGETGAFRLWLKGVPAKDAPGGALLLSGGSSVLGDFVSGQVNDRVLPLAKAAAFQSFGAIPIRTGEELAGALLCLFEPRAGMLPLDEAALDSVARIAGIALANYRLRERLVSSEERYRTLFEESPDALLVSALDGTVLDANEAAVRLYKVNRGEILGRYFGQLICADEREMARRRQIVWAQGRGTFKDRGQRPDGSEFPIEVEVRVVELGGQRRFLQLVRDLSDQERLQRELLQAQKMDAIGQLVSGVAHELNNPLAAIIAFSQLLRGDTRLPEDMKHDAGLLVQEADRTRRIVQNLLDFARARPPERRPTGIRVLVQSVLELQSYALSTNRIQVQLEIPPTLPEVDLDRAQLQQVLLNLTINAIQALRGRDRKTPAHLWVTAAVVKPRGAGGTSRTEKLLEDQQRVRITIRDDGPGVPEAARARLFDPFFTTKQPGEGTGLGLSVSFGIVAAHLGHLWYEPGPGNVGSCFIIELPVTARTMDERGLTEMLESDPRRSSATSPSPRSKSARAAAAAAASAASAAGAEVVEADDNDAGSRPPVTAEPAAKAVAAPPTSTAPVVSAEPEPETRRPRVLALDDEPSIRAFLRKALTVAGMDCSPFQDGAQALEGMRDSDFDVMLVDHRMAGMSGTEFYEAAIEFRPGLAGRVVFMSGDVLNPDLRGFATQRGIRLLAKPFDIDAVIRVVREVLASADEADEEARITPRS
jgi:PAS domain S-box-containing protein